MTMKKIVERKYTRDFRCPRVAGDDDWVYGFKCIPQPPSLDPAWEIFDSSKDYKTGWQRVLQLEFDF
jgi:hypothetical protein